MIFPSITRTSDNSNVFLFPLKVRIIGSWLYSDEPWREERSMIRHQIPSFSGTPPGGSLEVWDRCWFDWLEQMKLPECMGVRRVGFHQEWWKLRKWQQKVTNSALSSEFWPRKKKTTTRLSPRLEINCLFCNTPLSSRRIFLHRFTDHDTCLCVS